ncbi:MAG: SUMF1/EgtB/PvdO family nonheme iron enzyme, partial [Chloroflexi bacterium]|nr:SUMF1/EgtB/PvdO family nonheme iron enzyme [Chloroflexota bacterium]
ARIVGGVSHTVTGAVIGTPLYMSPEQGRGDPSDERSDIYSLGVILYEMATGVVPFTGDTPISVMMKHVTEPLRSPLAVNPDIPPLLAQVIETALAKNPADRFATAEAMSAALTLVKARLPATKPPGRASPSPSDPATVIESPVPAATTPAPRRVESGRRPEAAQAASVSSARAQPAERVSAPPPVIAEPRVATPMRPVPSPARAPGMPQAEAKPPAGRSWMTIGAVAIVGVCLLAAIVAGVFAIPRLTGSANTPVPTTGLATSAPGVLATAPQIATIAPTGTPGQVAHATGTALPAVTDTPPAVEGMIEIPAGEFIRGSDSAGAESRPQRRIALKAFLIDKTEVTNAQFAEFVKATGHKTYFESLGRTKNIWSVPRPNTAADSLPEYPVVFITWDDAHAFCKWAGKRLPTEAEWEKAARGADGNIFPWGNDFDPARSNSALNPNSPNGTMPVGSFPDGASPFGVLDMSGNVWEYVSDWYSGTYFAISPDADPPGPASGSGQVLRGGGWFNDKQIHLSAIFRDRGTPDFGDEATGFRCAKDAP